jgi:hypothetical protein
MDRRASEEVEEEEEEDEERRRRDRKNTKIGKPLRDNERIHISENVFQI